MPFPTSVLPYSSRNHKAMVVNKTFYYESEISYSLGVPTHAALQSMDETCKSCESLILRMHPKICISHFVSNLTLTSCHNKGLIKSGLHLDVILHKSSLLVT